ncbi:jmjC domain-containing protein 8-like [Penaeus chinensis]|uniref:jmjC domain-containing protein 8-like n=1 Tax=Penaeus chinensis TaxID=139456 RepID=UPI001FB7B8BD|nr:jmjC domain-containing protein 8-like [Penaeus chinensis]
MMGDYTFICRCLCLQIVLLFTLLTIVEVETESNLLDDDGGWTTEDKDRIAQPGPCNINVEDGSLSQEDFIKKYAYSEPVVIKGATDNQVFQTLTRRSALLEGYGHTTVRLSSANSYSYDKRDVTFNEYCVRHVHPQKLTTLGNETFYFFGDNNHEEWQDLLEQYIQPPYRLPFHLPALSFGLAGPGTGVPFHFHGPGFAETMWGRKRWFMYPPNVNPNFHPNRTTLQWLMEDYPLRKDDSNFYECTLNPGEIIYFPDKWWHATLNIDSSVFISTFLSP